MTTQKYNVDIEGIWRELNKADVPNHSGVYFVYEANYNTKTGELVMLTLLYVGESADVNGRIAEHEKYTEWLKRVRSRNELSFSTAHVESANRERVEAAYIFKHKPPCNTDFVNFFSYEPTTIISLGETPLIDTFFSVNP